MWEIIQYNFMKKTNKEREKKNSYLLFFFINKQKNLHIYLLVVHYRKEQHIADDNKSNGKNSNNQGNCFFTFARFVLI
jgi:hypothetical protein